MAQKKEPQHMTDLKVVDLYDSNHRDLVATLRRIADDIEAGEYGEVGCAALVIMGDSTEVFGMGEDSEPPSIALLLHGGFMKLSGAIAYHGK